jgi:hypothetical protein
MNSAGITFLFLYFQKFKNKYEQRIFYPESKIYIFIKNVHESYTQNFSRELFKLLKLINS